MEQKQYIKILYLPERQVLVATLNKLISAGNEISVVTALREFTCPNLDGIAVTDWLIIYKGPA